MWKALCLQTPNDHTLTHTHRDHSQSHREHESCSLWICCWLMVIAISERLYWSSLISGVHPQPKHPLTSERCIEECKQALVYKYSPPNNAATGGGKNKQALIMQQSGC